MIGRTVSAVRTACLRRAMVRWDYAARRLGRAAAAPGFWRNAALNRFLPRWRVSAAHFSGDAAALRFWRRFSLNSFLLHWQASSARRLGYAAAALSLRKKTALNCSILQWRGFATRRSGRAAAALGFRKKTALNCSILAWQDSATRRRRVRASALAQRTASKQWWRRTLLRRSIHGWARAVAVARAARSLRKRTAGGGARFVLLAWRDHIRRLREGREVAAAVQVLSLNTNFVHKQGRGGGTPRVSPSSHTQASRG